MRLFSFGGYGLALVALGAYDSYLFYRLRCAFFCLSFRLIFGEVSLAAADLLLVTVCAPLKTLQYLVIQWDAQGAICKLAEFAELLSAFASVLNLSAVTVERQVPRIKVFT